MIQLEKTNLYIGSVADLSAVKKTDWAIIHATQTIHYRLFGWDRKLNKPPQDHPNYIFYEKDDRLSLNWVDGAAKLYTWSGIVTFVQVLDFIDKWIKMKPTLIHCDQGHSRAPTLGLLYLAKRLQIISNDSFALARQEFEELYPIYMPSGIAEYVSNNWTAIS